MFPSLRQICLTSFVAASCSLGGGQACLQAEEEASLFAALPEETIAGFHISDPKGTMEAFKGTKAGKIFYDPARYEKVWQTFKEQNAEKYAEAEQSLAGWGLSFEDIWKLFGGEIGGAAMVLPSSSLQDEPPVLLTAWLRPEGDLGERLLKAIDRLVEEQDETDEALRIQRVDEEIAGVSVRHYTKASTKLEIEVSDDGDFQEKKQAGPPNHAWIAQVDGRMLFAFSPQRDAVDALLPALGKLIEGKPDEQGFQQKVMATPGMQQHLGQEGRYFQMLMNIGELLSVARASDTDPNDMVDLGKILDQLGIGDMRGAGFQASYKDGLHAMNGFVGMPAPRRGLAAMIDAEPQPMTVPAWLSTDAIGYSTLPMDLQSLHDLIKEAALTIGKDAAQMGFNRVDQQLQTHLQTNLRELLGMFGKRVSTVRYAYKPIKGDMQEFVKSGGNIDRAAVVLDVANQELWDKAFMWLNNILLVTGQFSMSQEQGFNCLRPNAQNPQMGMPQIGLFSGHGKVIITMGDGVDDILLADIRKAPEGDRAFANSAVFKQLQEMSTGKPSVAWGYQDNGEIMGSLVVMLQSLFTSFGDVLDEGDDAEITLIKVIMEEMLPSQEEIRDAFDINLGEMRVDQHGMSMQVIERMPLAE